MEDSLKYAEEVNPNLFCSICRMPFIDPYTTTNCHHTFCFLCIKEATSIAPQCPMCRCPTSIASLIPAPIIIRQMVDELLVVCPHARDGCLATPQRCLKDAHLRDSCQYALEKCTGLGCDVTLMRKDMADHRESHCSDAPVECDACHEQVRRGLLLQHQQTECRGAEVPCPACETLLVPADMQAHLALCPDVTIPCPQAAFGCPVVLPRCDMPSHTASCAYDKLKGFFSVFERKMDDLKLENEQLRRRVFELETKVAHSEAAQQELETSVGRALGPWFRVSGPEPYPLVWQDHEEYRNSISVFSRSGTPYERLWSDLEMPTSPLHASQPQSPVQIQQALLPLQPQPQSVSVSPTMPYPASYLPPPYPMNMVPSSQFHTPPAPTVPPVSPSSGGLAAALAALHGGLIRLSSYVEAQSRRNEMRLQTESLTIREEVGEMRSILHGLRLQVHSSLSRPQPILQAASRLSSLLSPLTSGEQTTPSAVLSDSPSPTRPDSPIYVLDTARGSLRETTIGEPRDPNDTSSMTVVRPERPERMASRSALGRVKGVHMHTVSRVDGKL
ncbi:hypothetical protein DACRYDRAFT_114728 [Dacryopinax primogenitus]|uniref:RING-type domain-containing protein n=1 Tax=Dacryopinax primogenitus (strain DJM 731) TaxID=1858805 RepID=M5G8B9_DACPD|nr:uncharacterized protein DACRYDRAFT_114728 [Dacryopinax primogenitus]EJU04395.1 hypothetical protein DACRYDRAFT_114728 [Dacryopinax primogenitus]